MAQTGKVITDSCEYDNKQLSDKNAECKYVFIGDSISRHWPQHVFKSYFNTSNDAMIYAHDGDAIHDILWRLNNQNGFEKMKKCLLNGKAEQKNLILLVGTNDITYGQSHDDALKDYKSLLTQLVEFINDVNGTQKVVLYVMAIFPRRQDFGQQLWKSGNEYFENVACMNAFLKRFIEHQHSYKIQFVNCNEVLLDNFGEFGPNTGNVSTAIFEDGLHLSSEGYGKWSQCLLDFMAM